MSFITYMGKRVGDARRVYGATTGLEGLKYKLHPQRLDANAPIAMEGRCDLCPASLQLPGHTPAVCQGQTRVTGEAIATIKPAR